MPGQDLTSDLNLNIERGSNTNDSFVSYSNVTKSNRSSMKFDFNENKTSNASNDEIKTPDFDQNYIFQVISGVSIYLYIVQSFVFVFITHCFFDCHHTF